jgi:hypothetical protein
MGGPGQRQCSRLWPWLGLAYPVSGSCGCVRGGGRVFVIPSLACVQPRGTAFRERDLFRARSSPPVRVRSLVRRHWTSAGETGFSHRFLTQIWPASGLTGKHDFKERGEAEAGLNLGHAPPKRAAAVAATFFAGRVNALFVLYDRLRHLPMRQPVLRRFCITSCAKIPAQRRRRSRRQRPGTHS